MCGITGIWTRTSCNDRIREELADAVARLRHRGPDDEGIWINGSGLGLGHTRLSILDLSELGHQPMVSSDRNRALVFNGEIYNFAEIRSRLESTGHSFAGSGDTEVILHAFDEWGSDAVTHFIGMFAIAYWDESEQKLELTRDRMGVKPLYYSWDGRTFTFGSELKSLRAFTHWTPTIDLQSLGEFLQYGYIAGDRTIFKNIYKLRPGHRLILRRNGEPEVAPYWSPLDAIGDTPALSDREFEEHIEELLVSACRYRMVSDVPVGVYLSGGIDSSLVTAILAKHYDQRIRTFTIGFDKGSHDESAWAKRVAEYCGTDHTEYVLGVDEALKIAKNWGELFDEPFGDSSGIPTLLVSRLAAQRVKVVLSADGGDELFSGYRVYDRVLKRARQLQGIPSWISKSSIAALELLVGRGSEKRSSRFTARTLASDEYRKLRRLADMLRNPTPGPILDYSLSMWRPNEIARLVGAYNPPRPDADSYPGDAATKLSLWDIDYYLPEDILTKVDRTTMAVSIEGREPLLDHRLVEAALGLPAHLRRGQLGPKHILKSILHRYIPREYVDRPKHGFGIPLADWLRSDLKDLLHDHLSESNMKAAGTLDPDLVGRAVSRFYSGDSTLTTPIWLLLAFQMWQAQWYRA